MGMPTQTLSPDAIAAAHGRVEGFVAPVPGHPVSHGLPAGQVTDDTEQTLLLARVLLRSGGGFDQALWVDALLGWERGVRARGGLDLLGPSTRRALDAIAAGAPPEEAGREGSTNGAAMRIAPVGIAVPPAPLGALVDRVAETCRATHGTGLAIAAASAVAAAVSHGVSGGDWRGAAEAAIPAARMGARRGHWVAGADIAARIRWARDLVRNASPEEAEASIRDLVGTSLASQESVPAAFAALEAARGDAWEAAVICANLGGDTDTIGAIACAIAGACCGAAALPAERIAALRGFDPDAARGLAERLLDRRRAA